MSFELSPIEVQIKDSHFKAVSSDGESQNIEMTIKEDNLQAMAQEAQSNPSLIPPQGYSYGSWAYSMNPTCKVTPNPILKGVTAKQDFSVLLNGNFYAYNANGYGRDDFYVVYVQDWSTNPGTLLVNNQNARGYQQYEVVVQNAVVDLSTKKPFANGVSTQSSSPQFTQGQAQVSTELSLPMQFSVPSGQGKVNEAWTASFEKNNSLVDWDSAQIDPGNSTSGWDYYQATPWNPKNDNPGNFGQWWKQVFGGDHKDVKPFPGLSQSSLSATTLSVWKFDQSLIKGNSLPVIFESEMSLGIASISNRSGSTNGHHMITSGVIKFGWYCTVDIVKLGRQHS